MRIELTPKEVDILYNFAENPEQEIDDYTLDRLVKAAVEGFTCRMTLSLEHPITIKRVCNLKPNVNEILGA